MVDTNPDLEEFQALLRRLVSRYLSKDCMPPELGELLTKEALLMMSAYAPNSEVMYSTVFTALAEVSNDFAKELLDQDEMNGRQNAPGTDVIQ